MAEVLALALTFPSVVFTVLLGVVLVYWLFVVAGAVNLGDGGSALEGFEGAAKGALEGAAKGALEGAAKGVLEGHIADVPDAGDVGDLGDSSEASVLTALMSALHLGAVPVTVVVSLLVTFSWLCSMVFMQVLTRLLGGAGSFVFSVLGLVLSPLVALPLTALATRPLARVFVKRSAPTRSDLIGKVCVVRTGKVTPTFGEGVLEDGGAGLVLRVRVDGEGELKRGQHALIVEWDDERDAFVVEPMDELVSGSKPGRVA